MHERTYRQLNPHARLDAGIERARSRHHYKATVEVPREAATHWLSRAYRVLRAVGAVLRMGGE